MDLAQDPNPALARAVPTASSGDAEQGPPSAPILLMSRFAMLGGAHGRGETERCLLKKISIHISAEGSTAEGGLSLSGCGLPANSVKGRGMG
jgi:hypothetical protein